MDKYSTDYEALGKILYSEKSREIREDELAFYEYGIKAHAEKYQMNYTQLLQHLTNGFNEAQNNLTPKDLHIVINHPREFPQKNLKANFNFHAQASEIFSRIIFDNSDIRYLLYDNNEFLKESLGDYDLNSKLGLNEFLLNSNFYLLVEREFNAMVINKASQKSNNQIYFNIGVPDILLQLAHFICKNSFIVINDTLIPINIKRNYIKMVDSLLTYRNIISQNYLSIKYDYTELSKLQSLQMFLIQNGGINFVLFHEYCHLLLGNTIKKNELELLCDKIAFKAILKIGEPILAIGAYLGLYMMMLGNITRGENEDSYPHPLRRYNQTVLLIEGLNDDNFHRKMNSYDKLLNIPHRHYEEEVYKMSTKNILRTRFENYLASAKNIYSLPIDKNNISELSYSIIDSSISITAPSDDYLVTVRNDKSGQSQYVHFNTKTAIAILTGSLSTLGWSVDPTQFGLMFLSMILFINDGVLKKIKNNDAVLFGIIYSNNYMKIEIEEAQRKFNDILMISNSESNPFNVSLENLINLNVVRTTDNLVAIKDIVLKINI